MLVVILIVLRWDEVDRVIPKTLQYRHRGVLLRPAQPCVHPAFVHSAGSAALAEVYTLLSVILVIYLFTKSRICTTLLCTLSNKHHCHFLPLFHLYSYK